MANILIDGYNLIGIAHKNLEKARNDLLKKLSMYAKIKSHSITVVFDGWKNGQATETRTRVEGIIVIYSSLGEKADYVITKLLSSSQQIWIIVSSDREIYNFAEKKNLVAISANVFEKKLYSALSATGHDEESLENDEDLDQAHRWKKGNPKKLSKKNKRMMEAFKKL
jgi:hypothetical protein